MHRYGQPGIMYESLDPPSLWRGFFVLACVRALPKPFLPTPALDVHLTQGSAAETVESQRSTEGGSGLDAGYRQRCHVSIAIGCADG